MLWRRFCCCGCCGRFCRDTNGNDGGKRASGSPGRDSDSDAGGARNRGSLLFPLLDVNLLLREARGELNHRDSSPSRGRGRSRSGRNQDDASGVRHESGDAACSALPSSTAERAPAPVDAAGRRGRAPRRTRPTRPAFLPEALVREGTAARVTEAEFEALQRAVFQLEAQLPFDEPMHLLCRIADLRRELVLYRTLRLAKSDVANKTRLHGYLMRLDAAAQRVQQRLPHGAEAERLAREAQRGVVLENQAAKLRHVSERERYDSEARYLSINTITFLESGAPLKRASSVRDIGARLRLDRTRGDGRCLFRSVARGLAYLSGLYPGGKWSSARERREADVLRYLCASEIRRHRELFLRDCVFEDEFEQHVRRLLRTDEFAGEPEMLVLAPLCQTPICVYVGDEAGGFTLIAVYGRSFVNAPVNVRFRGQHYDLLLPSTTAAAAAAVNGRR